MHIHQISIGCPYTRYWGREGLYKVQDHWLLSCGHTGKVKRSFGSGTGIDNLVSWLWASSVHSCFLSQMTFQGGQCCKLQASYVIYNTVFMLHKSTTDHLFSAGRNHLTVMAQDSCLSLSHQLLLRLNHAPPINYLPSASLQLCSARPGRAMRTHVRRSKDNHDGNPITHILSMFSAVVTPVIVFLGSQICCIWNTIGRNGALSTGQSKGDFLGPVNLVLQIPVLFHYKSPPPLLMPRLLPRSTPNYSSTESLEAFKNQNAERQIHYKNKFISLGV